MKAAEGGEKVGEKEAVESGEWWRWTVFQRWSPDARIAMQYEAHVIAYVGL